MNAQVSIPTASSGRPAAVAGWLMAFPIASHNPHQTWRFVCAKVLLFCEDVMHTHAYMFLGACWQSFGMAVVVKRKVCRFLNNFIVFLLR